jgi:hypothetical protein
MVKGHRLLLALTASMAAMPLLAAADSSLDRLRSLIEEKRRLEWENKKLTQEIAFASTPSPYIYVDVTSRTFEFRVRGRSHKTYTATALEARRATGAPVTPEQIGALLPDALGVEQKAAGPPVLQAGGPAVADANVALDPNAAPDPNGGPMHSDAGVLGVDAPEEYDIELQEGVRLEIRNPVEGSRWDRVRTTFSAIGSAFSGLWSGLFGGTPAPVKGQPRVTLRVVFDKTTAKAFYHSILPGEKVVFVTAPPPPVTLLAKTEAPSRAPATPSSRPVPPPKKPASASKPPAR